LKNSEGDKQLQRAGRSRSLYTHRSCLYRQNREI